MGLRFDDDLVFCIYRSHANVALDHAFAGGHFGAVIVRAVAFADGAFAAFAVFRMVGQPFPELRRIRL